ncbi:hypothetical protein GYH30_054766 [Glycine max]|uniref:Uncharacterized protein n=1 Tax=Glycine max TaxID=3847 RepID=K7N1G7_SOYBN|nr:hypothetical protein GYH30_054766 [Glycine max]
MADALVQGSIVGCADELPERYMQAIIAGTTGSERLLGKVNPLNDFSLLGFWPEVHFDTPVTILTCLLGLTNGYLTSVLIILIPKIVKLQHAETTGIMSVLFLGFGLAAGSIIAWIWVI